MDRNWDMIPAAQAVDAEFTDGPSRRVQAWRFSDAGNFHPYVLDGDTLALALALRGFKQLVAVDPAS